MFSDGTYGTKFEKIIDLTNENLVWKTESEIFQITNNNNLDITKFRVFIVSYLSDGPLKWIELDGVELFDINKNYNLIDADTGSFNREYNEVHNGDWASNVIARLGGIAWWGSSSHFLTGGYAFLLVMILLVHFTLEKV